MVVTGADACDHRPISARGYDINRRRAPLGWIRIRPGHQGKHARRKRYVRWTALLAVLIAVPTAWLGWRQSALPGGGLTSGLEMPDGAPRGRMRGADLVRRRPT